MFCTVIHFYSPKYFLLVSDISHMNRTTDLRDHDEKTVLVKETNMVLNDDVDWDYTEVVQMDPLIETYRRVYINDLEEHIGIKSYKFPATLGVTMLLNLMFDLKRKVVGLG